MVFDRNRTEELTFQSDRMILVSATLIAPGFSVLSSWFKHGASFYSQEREGFLETEWVIHKRRSYVVDFFWQELAPRTVRFLFFFCGTEPIGTGFHLRTMCCQRFSRGTETNRSFTQNLAFSGCMRVSGLTLLNSEILAKRKRVDTEDRSASYRRRIN